MEDESDKPVEEVNLKLSKDNKVLFDHPYMYWWSLPWAWGLLILGFVLFLYFYYS